MPVPMIAAFMHDFEVERVRVKQAREGDNKPTGDIFAGFKIVDIDDRIPLSVRGKPFIEWQRWVIEWNKKNPDDQITPPTQIAITTI